MSRHKGYHTNQLIFPSNWTGKWLYRAIINTPKWQINSVLGSAKYGQWYGLLEANLNGLRLVPKTDDLANNVVRSIQVGVKVREASTQYEQLYHKLPYEQEVERVNQLLAQPIVGDMVRTLTEAVLPAPMPEPVAKKSVELPAPNMMPEEFEETKVKYRSPRARAERKEIEEIAL